MKVAFRRVGIVTCCRTDSEAVKRWLLLVEMLLMGLS